MSNVGVREADTLPPFDSPNTAADPGVRGGWAPGHLPLPADSKFVGARPRVKPHSQPSAPRFPASGRARFQSRLAESAACGSERHSCSCSWGRGFSLEASTALRRVRQGVSARLFPGARFQLRPGSGAAGRGTCPVEGFMMQPPVSAAVLQLQPLSRVSWFIPKLWPSSCARVTAAPRGLSEWSSKKTQEHRLTAHISPACFPVPLLPGGHFSQHFAGSMSLEGTHREPRY